MQKPCEIVKTFAFSFQSLLVIGVQWRFLFRVSSQ